MDYISEGISRAISLLVSFDEQTYSAIFATVKASTSSIILSLLIGLPAGFVLGYMNFPGRRQIRALMDTLLSLPTVLVGLLVYSLLSRQGPLGGLGILFTIPGIVIGQSLLILPIVISLTAASIEELDKRLYLTALTLGADRRQIIFTSLYEARFSLMTAAVTAFGRVISEVGISMMVGGNIKWYTRTITTAIALESGKGEFALGIALGIVLLIISLSVNAALIFYRKRV